MCGITGFINLDKCPADPLIIRRMTTAVSHRGPDGQGIKLMSHVALGHRRLAIIDPRLGSQPMTDAARKIWITYNGELYNFKLLKGELSRAGLMFRTQSDTEVILAAYQRWGPGCVHHFRGMFAFAIWDREKDLLFLARDPLGIKPLFYFKTSSVFVFASEIQGLTAHPEFSSHPDLEALDEFLCLQYIRAPKTAFLHLKKLPPAHTLIVKSSGNLTLNRYWQPDFTNKLYLPIAAWTEKLEAAIEDSVRAHLVSDVPFGALLSGGLDSSLVVSQMSRMLSSPVETFSIGFKESGYSELTFARLVAKKFHTHHHESLVSADSLSILPDLVRHFGEPFGDSSAIPMYYLARMVKKNVSMALSGDGGDELFAGYPIYADWQQIGISGLINSVRQTLRFRRKIITGSSFHNWLGLINYFPFSYRQQLWRADIYRPKDYLSSEWRKLFQSSQKYSLVNQAQFMDLNTYLPSDILPKTDIAAMSFGLEVRTPLVDHQLLETVSQIPQDFLMDNAGNGKLVLKQLLTRYFPRNFINRPKRGFAIPIRQWLSKPLTIRKITDRLLGSSSHLKTYFREEGIRHVIEVNPDQRLWMLLFLDEWLHQNRL